VPPRDDRGGILVAGSTLPWLRRTPGPSPFPLAATNLAEGRVIKPFELSFPVQFAYYVVYPESKTVMPKVRVLSVGSRRKPMQQALQSL
jgi:hypothetical protein